MSSAILGNAKTFLVIFSYSISVCFNDMAKFATGGQLWLMCILLRKGLTNWIASTNDEDFMNLLSKLRVVALSFYKPCVQIHELSKWINWTSIF